MRFQNTANGPPIADGPHRIEQTATWPAQLLFAVSAIEVARIIVGEAHPLVPEVPRVIRLPDLPEPVVAPPGGDG